MLQCRLRDMTYSAPITVDIEYTRGTQVNRINIIHLQQRTLVCVKGNVILASSTHEGVHFVWSTYNNIFLLLHMPTYYKLLNRIRLGHVDLNGLSCTLILVAYTYESVALLHQVSNELFIYFFPSLQRVVRHNLPIGRYVLNYFVFWSVVSDQDGYVFLLLPLFTNFTKILD